ncbi:EscS/YscS/HrcS family type III secretion system export apparatus protein, partial [Achromobacter dolens]
LFSLFQALTQIQEQTLSFAIKLIAVFATILLTARWLSAELYNFTISVFDLFYKIH